MEKSLEVIGAEWCDGQAIAVKQTEDWRVGPRVANVGRSRHIGMANRDNTGVADRAGSLKNTISGCDFKSR